MSDRAPWRNLEAVGVGWVRSLDDHRQFVDAIVSVAAMTPEERLGMQRRAHAYADRAAASAQALDTNRQLIQAAIEQGSGKGGSQAPPALKATKSRSTCSMSAGECLVVFDRRGVDFLPPCQLALQTEKLVNTVVVNGAVPWRQASELPCRKRVTRCVAQQEAHGRRILYKPFVLPERHGLACFTGPLNRSRLRRELLAIVGQATGHAVLYDSCAQLPLVGTLGESQSAYYLYDDFGVDLTGRPHGWLDRGAEQQMMAAVDVVFAVSQKLCDYAAAHARQVQYLPNGFNADLFIPRPKYEPPGRAGRKPVIGYSGVISGRVDFGGLLKTAIERPDWEFRMVGQVIPKIEREFEQTGRPGDLFQKFLTLPNVEHLASRPIAEMPSVVASFDVALVPYCLNAFTMASSPLKVYEYYAMGLPVVSTRIPEVLRFDPQIETANQGESYAAPIARALQAGDDEGFRSRQIAIAAPHSTLARACEVVTRLLPGASD